ncbi:MAG: 16S rRNA (cytidine(1402)-2'-O)-methyltransferase [Alphaproteobacteria bacterium]|nr:16S rRNA (cytidine(1402)-2'-O)-methyltransferase [Alphaproteobacteria bacterium]
MSAPQNKSKNQSPLAGGLYIVATPLGHVRDITLRALDVLGAVDMIYCEDTRHASKLLAHHAIQTQKAAYHEHNGEKMRPKILAQLAEGQSLALISDAGTPLISDPGMKLVRDARAAGHHVVAVPGASAPIAALSVAGLPSDRFTFVGFLPPKTAARQTALNDLQAARSGTLVLFETARRLPALLDDIEAVYGACELCVARELTKTYEEVETGTPDKIRAHFSADNLRGEITLLIAPPAAGAPDGDAIDAMLADALATMGRRDAVQAVAEMTGQPRRRIYARALDIDTPRTGASTQQQKEAENAETEKPDAAR